MAFKDFSDERQGVQLLQRSMERGRLAHAYLFTGNQLDGLESIALTLAKTLNCLRPARSCNGVAIDCCDECANCRKIDHGNHADVHWVRPESRSRVVTIQQMRDLIQEINLRPTEAEYKVAGIVAADRLNVQAANAFLKTLEEPPASSVLVLMTTEPQRLLETILSRCLRLNLSGEGARSLSPAEKQWLDQFSELAAVEQKSLLARYRLLDVLLQKLSQLRTNTEDALKARSPLQQYEDAEKEVRDRWEDELNAAIEAEYRRQRADLLAILERWFRDIWLQTLARKNSDGTKLKAGDCTQETPGEDWNRGLLDYPEFGGSSQVARRITSKDALKNLEILERTQRLLHTNVQEALALEVGLLKLKL